MASLPGLGRGDTLFLTNERANQLIQEFNAERTPIAVAALPSALQFAGFRRIVTDATVTTFASIVVGGGANCVPVYADNAGNWRIGG
jgi:hypothetical protein